MNRRKYPRAALSVLALCLFASAAMLVSPAASGQKGSRIAEEISHVLTSFETVTLDPAEVLRDVREDGVVTLSTGRGAFDLEVEPYDIRSDDYRAVAAGEGGVMTELPRTLSNSWRGKVRGQTGTVVRLYLDGRQVQGVIITPGQTFFIEPARALSSAAGSKDFVFYEAASVRPVDAHCEEVTLGGKVAAEVARGAAATSVPRADEAFAPMPEARLATEADFEFFQVNGNNETTTNNDINGILTQVDGIYEAQLGISLRVVFQRVWTTSNDPYTLFDASDALDQFAEEYDATFGVSNPPTRELTHMFTGKDFVGTTIGIAYRGVVCDFPDASYGISQSRFSNTTALRVAVTAHEIGHNFNATHTGPSGNPNDPSTQIPGCDLAGAAMMQPGVSSAATGFCQFSRDQITSHVTGTGGSCLTRLTQPGCSADSYAITPSVGAFTAAGGAGTVNVTANAGCNWGVAEGVSWVNFNTLTGTGPGATGFTVAANDGKDGPRRAFADIGGKQFSIFQQASPTCLNSATPIGIGQTLTGALTTSDCFAAQPGRLTAFEDLYTFSGRAGQRVRIEMTATGSPVIDTYLYLFAPDGTLVAENDDIVLGAVTNSRIPVTAGAFFELPQTGVYTIGATTFDLDDTGSYTIKLSDSGVSLSAAAYSVDEGTGGGGLGVDGTGFRVVTVTRTGDAAEIAANTVTVDYATSDGTASRLKDYQQTLGTLVFGPGETSKSFTVFVPDDAFAEAPETVQLTLSNPVGTALGATATATLTINSNDATSGPSPVRAQSFNTAFFVRQQYLDFLSREPDTSGFNFWTGDLNQCGADEPCKEVKRINVSAAFFQSIEFQNTGYLVYRTYKAAYGDATSPGVAGTVPVIRLTEFLPDTQRIGRGVIVNQGDWQAQLEANKNSYMAEFVQRQRFLTAYPLTMTAAQFVDKLNQNAGGVLTQSERDQLVTQLSANPADTTRRAAALRSVSENAALQQNEFRRAFVLMQYYGYLRRNPDDAPEPGLNFAGWKFWLDKLNEFNGNFVNAEMVKAFITSDEYITRFGN